MKIGPYSNLTGSGNRLFNLTGPDPERNQSLPPFEEIEKNIKAEKMLIASEKIRLQVKQYADELKSYQEHISRLQGVEKFLAESAKYLQKIQAGLAEENYSRPSEEGKDAIKNNLDEFMQLVQRTAGYLEKSNKKLFNSFQKIAAKLREGPVSVLEDSLRASCYFHDLNNDFASFQKKVAAEKEKINQHVAGLMVAMENIIASRSLIRDPGSAEKTLEGVINQVALNLNITMSSTANLQRENVLKLLG